MFGQSSPALTRIFTEIKDAVFPRFCLICCEEGSLLCGICRSDWTAHAPKTVCSACESPSAFGAYCMTCRGDDMPSGKISSFHYGDPVVRGLLRAWKYHYDMQGFEILKDAIPLEPLRDLIEAKKIDTIVPLPLHVRKACRRGFDQAEMIATYLGDRLDLPVKRFLARSIYTKTQAEQQIADRKHSMVKSPFILTNKEYKNERVLLVDDVWTTGATASAAARTLLEGGVEEVWVYAVAEGG
jgi:ComF family protein